jgi:hypothetical protein
LPFRRIPALAPIGAFFQHAGEHLIQGTLSEYRDPYLGTIDVGKSSR